MQREDILKAIDAAYAARVNQDAVALAELWTGETTFEVEGQKSLIEAFPPPGRWACTRR